MGAEIMSILPWALALVLTIADIVRHATHVSQGHHPVRHLLSIAGLLWMGTGWALLIVSAGPAPVLPRPAMLGYIRLCVSAGAGLLLLVNIIEAAAAVRRYESRGDST